METPSGWVLRGDSSEDVVTNRTEVSNYSGSCAKGHRVITSFATFRKRKIADIRTGYMKITDLGNVKVPMEENSGGHLVVRLKEQPKTRYVWWRTTDWLENEKEWKKIWERRRLHLQFGHCSDGQIMNIARQGMERRNGL